MCGMFGALVVWSVVVSVSFVGGFFFQAEDGIRDLVRSRGLGDVYKRQVPTAGGSGAIAAAIVGDDDAADFERLPKNGRFSTCLLYTSDAADERSSVDLGGRRIIKKKIHLEICSWCMSMSKQHEEGTLVDRD